MFDTIRGTLLRVSAESATVDTGGIGWRLFVPASYLKRLAKIGTEVNFFVSLVTREHSQTLFGFLKEEERLLFEKLLNINGIGPKTALALMGHLASDELAAAILRKDSKILQKVPGIGKKTAERLLVDLKDALPLVSDLAMTKSESASLYFCDAVSALENLGYSRDKAQGSVKKAIEKGGSFQDLSALICASLKPT